jgi:hypothetical protein
MKEIVWSKFYRRFRFDFVCLGLPTFRGPGRAGSGARSDRGGSIALRFPVYLSNA